MPEVQLGMLPANPGFKDNVQWLAQNIPFQPGVTTQAYNLPTDQLLKNLVFRIHGIPAGTTSAAGTLNAPFGEDLLGNKVVPALVNALGLITLTGKPQDGSDGINVNNVSATQLALDSFLMTSKVPSSDVDFDPSTPATYCSATCTLHFEDQRLGSNSYLTAMEAMRYGEDKDLSVRVQFGELNSSALKPDMSVSVGGTYTGLAAGTLVMDIGYTQKIPTNFVWPDWQSDNAIPMFDRDFEYLNELDITQSQGQNVTLARRRLQANTIWELTQVQESGVEDGANNLGVAPNTFLQQKLGGTILDQLDPTLMQNNAEVFEVYGGTGIPVGVYFYNDWNNDFVNGVSLKSAKGSHSWSTNPGSSEDAQNLRCLHITYNPSARAIALNKGL